MQAELKVVEGKQQGAVIPLNRKKFLIGREEDCQLRPNSDLVSRHHCVFTLDDFTVRLRDLGSTNGTFVNGQRATGQVVLHDGDEIKIGKLVFQIAIWNQVQGQAQTPPPASMPTPTPMVPPQSPYQAPNPYQTPYQMQAPYQEMPVPYQAPAPYPMQAPYPMPMEFPPPGDTKFVMHEPSGDETVTDLAAGGAHAGDPQGKTGFYSGDTTLIAPKPAVPGGKEPLPVRLPPPEETGADVAAAAGAPAVGSNPAPAPAANAQANTRSSAADIIKQFMTKRPSQ